VPAEVVAGVVDVEGLADVFGLKKSTSVFFAGEGDAATVGEAAAVPFALRPCFSVGEGDASAAVSVEGEVAAAAFALWPRFAAGEGDASVPAPGEALLSGEAVLLASVFLCDLCLPADGDGVGVGDWALTRQLPARPVISKKASKFVFMSGSLNKKAPKMED
jgi:hypothetical protein